MQSYERIEEVLLTIQDWRFKPGMTDGKPVAVRVEIEMSFSLQEPEEPRRGPALDSPEVFLAGNGVTEPKLVRGPHPNYTGSSIRAGAQGLVKMKCVVLPDGTVGDVRLTQRLQPDVDQASVRPFAVDVHARNEGRSRGAGADRSGYDPYAQVTRRP